MYVQTVNCSCGALSLAGLTKAKKQSPKALIREIKKAVLAVTPGKLKNWTLIFSDTKSRGNGATLASIIKTYKLGKISSPPGYNKNPRTGNMIKSWIWVVDAEAVNNFLKGK